MASKDKAFEDYEKIADWFDDVRLRDLVLERSYLEMVAALTKPNGKILDLGCGMGEPVTKYFIDKGFQVTGVDGSHKMIEKARHYVPQATFLVSDIRYLNLEAKFDAIILWHSLIHLPHEDQQSLFTRLKAFIKPRGILAFTSGHEAGEEWSNNGGQNLYHASLSPAEYQELLESHHFDLITHKIKDADCGDSTVWVSKYRENQLF